MSETGVEIRPFDPREATDADVAAWNDCLNALHAEQWPEDRPCSVERRRRSLLSDPPIVRNYRWAAWTPDGSRIVAAGGLFVWYEGQNMDHGGFYVEVLPEARRTGIGTRFLRGIADGARAENRTMLFTSAAEAVPAGQVFLEKLGGKLGQRESVNQLEVKELNRSLLREWQERAAERAPGFTLGLWDGPYPEEALDDVVAMKEAVNLMPRGNLEFEDEHVTADQLRQWDASMVKRGSTRWTMYARDPESGRIAGYTEVYWHPEDPEVMNQGDTAVFKEFQNRGLGRWLKAAMMEKVLRDRPEVQRMRTGNADTNAPMLKINYDLGFRLRATHSQWQIPREKVEAYLAARGV